MIQSNIKNQTAFLLDPPLQEAIKFLYATWGIFSTPFAIIKLTFKDSPNLSLALVTQLYGITFLQIRNNGYFQKKKKSNHFLIKEK